MRLFTWLSLWFLMGGFSFVKTHDLRIQVQGHSSQKGNFRMALYRYSDPFPSENKAYKQKVQKVSDSEIVIEDLPENTYALALFHDENKNEILDKNLLGVPTEKYGFSNNARGVFSAPDFKDAAIVLNQSRLLIIKIK